ncbi:DUF4307 domain-containing protein [Mycolicibacterium moriokaense]|nr:DUF4307 domain-containing protein [Mycolicibacterium moriokaense]
MIDRPSARYGRQRMSRRSRRRWAIGLTALVLLAGVVVAIVASQRLGRGDVQGELGGYQVVDAQTLAVTVKVTRADPSRPVVCIVRARSIDGSETGRRELLVPPSSQATVTITATVKSTRPPVAGDVYGCGTDVPGYLVAS